MTDKNVVDCEPNGTAQKPPSEGSALSGLRRGVRSVLRVIEARYGAKAPAEARSRVRLRLYPPSDRFCRNCAAFVPDRAEAILAEAPPTFREVTKWLSPAAMATNASGALDGNAQRAWKNLGECTRDPDEGMLVHPNGPDCGRWR